MDVGSIFRPSGFLLAVPFEGYGFKLNLGLVRDMGAANNLLKWILAVLAEQKPGSDVTNPIRTLIHKEGISGAMNIMAELALSSAGHH